MKRSSRATLRLSSEIPRAYSGISPLTPTSKPRSASAVFIAWTLTFIRVGG
jgi:hypothetical protein